jgi:hypothetical protein
VQEGKSGLLKPTLQEATYRAELKKMSLEALKKRLESEKGLELKAVKNAPISSARIHLKTSGAYAQ